MFGTVIRPNQYGVHPGDNWRSPVLAARVVVASLALLVVSACGKDQPDSQSGTGGMGPGGGPAAGQGGPAGGMRQAEAVLAIEERFQTQLTRTTAGEPVSQPWLLPAAATPTAAAGPEAGKNAPQDGPRGGGTPGGQPAPLAPLTWRSPAVILGRTDLYVDGASIAKLECVGEPDRCKPEALTGRTGDVVLRLPATAVSADGLVAALTSRAGGWKGQTVAVLPDRRVAWQSVAQVIKTLEAAGAKPVLAGASYEGGLVAVLPRSTSAAPPVKAPAPEPAGGTDTAQDPIPSDLTRMVVEVRKPGVSMLMYRAGAAEPSHPTIMGNISESLVNYAERARAAAPSAAAFVLVEEDVPCEEVVRVLDGLGDTCARGPKGVPCADRTLLYPTPAVELAGASTPAEAPAAPTPTAVLPPPAVPPKQ